LRRGNLKKAITISFLILLVLLSGCLSETQVQQPVEDLDSDGDGWTDAQEAVMKTNPYQVDSDGDGLTDPEDPNPLLSEPQVPIEEHPETTLAPATTTPTITQATTTSSTSTSTTKPTLEPTKPTDYEISKIADGYEYPLYLTHAGDGSKRMFILEQQGKIKIVDKKLMKIDTPFLDITSRVKSGGERGLLGLAFHPSYVENGFFYVHYSDISGDTVISRFEVSENPDLADPNSEEILLNLDQPFGNHNGGQIAFGPDGFLYIGLGDGGAAADPLGNGQDPSTLLGTILRINVDEGLPYTVPIGNPFIDTPTARSEVWAYGLRNPWRFSFDRLTGDLYIGDVGQGNWEEIDFQPFSSNGGENYGWNQMEGNHCFISGCSPELYVPAISEYSHSDGCSVTGGYVYRGTFDPGLDGTYFYGDYCSGKIWGLRKSGEGVWTSDLWFETSLKISSFGEDEAGELCVVDHNGGIYRIKEKS
jgi:glucose/arabinose dehydrogenase